MLVSVAVSMDQELLGHFLLFLLFVFIAMVFTFYDLEMFLFFPQAVHPTTSAGFGGYNEASMRKAKQLEMAKQQQSTSELDSDLSMASKKRVAHAGATADGVSSVFFAPILIRAGAANLDRTTQNQKYKALDKYLRLAIKDRTCSNSL